MEVNCLNKLAWIAILLIALIAGVVVASAVQNYLSPEIEVTIEAYALTLTIDPTTYALGDTLNFSGTFTTDSFFIIGQNITLWCDGLYTGFSNLTDDVGYYEILYPATINGTFTFYTNTTVTET